jgi:hypothetical protein
MADEPGITRYGESLDNIVWNILGQTYKPVQLSEASFAFDTLFPPGTFVPPHFHPEQDEFIRVLEGDNALPHSVRELAALGLLPRLDEIAIRTRQLTYCNYLGQQIWSEPRGMFAGHDVPQFSIHRGRLQTMLW